MADQRAPNGMRMVGYFDDPAPREVKNGLRDRLHAAIQQYHEECGVAPRVSSHETAALIQLTQIIAGTVADLRDEEGA